MTKTSADKIYEYYKEDFINFGYEKDDYSDIIIAPEGYDLFLREEN